LERRVEITRTVTFFGWFAGAAVLVWLLGIVVGLPIFVLLYTYIDGREKWWMSLLMGVSAFVLVWGLFEGIFEVLWPPGLFFE